MGPERGNDRLVTFHKGSRLQHVGFGTFGGDEALAQPPRQRARLRRLLDGIPAVHLGVMLASLLTKGNDRFGNKRLELIAFLRGRNGVSHRLELAIVETFRVGLNPNLGRLKKCEDEKGNQRW